MHTDDFLSQKINILISALDNIESLSCNDGIHYTNFESIVDDVHTEACNAFEKVNELEFNMLSARWKEATRLMSNITDITSHKDYLTIINMGKSIIHLIIKDLKDNGPNHWYTALNKITGIDPVDKEDRGDMEKMKQAWIKCWRCNEL